MGVDLNLRLNCPHCHKGVDFVWLGRFHYYADGLEIESLDEINRKISFHLSSLLKAWIEKSTDTEYLEFLFDEAVSLGEKKLLAKILEDNDVEPHIC